MTKFGYEKRKRDVLRRRLNIADVMRGGRLFQKLAPEAVKARLPRVERLIGHTPSWLKVSCHHFSSQGRRAILFLWGGGEAGAFGLVFKVA